MAFGALHRRHLFAAVVFVGAVLVLAIQLITPSPVMVTVGENGTETAQLGQYFTYHDVALISTAAALLGASGTYLLLGDPANSATSMSQNIGSGTNTKQESASNSELATQSTSSTSGDATDPEPTDRDVWEDVADRLRNSEETVYTMVIEAGGDVPQRRIVEETDLSKATVSRTLDTLEHRDLLERKRRGMGNVVELQTPPQYRRQAPQS